MNKNLYLGFTAEGCMDWAGKRKADNEKIGTPVKITYPIILDSGDREELIDRLKKCIDALEPDAVSVEGDPDVRSAITADVSKRDDVKLVEVVNTYMDPDYPAFSDFGATLDTYIGMEETKYEIIPDDNPDIAQE